MEDEKDWRDPEIARAYVKAALEDSFYLAIGRRLWDASLVRVPTLIVAGERDFWSRPEDCVLLEKELVHAPKVKVTVIPGATHFVHLDRPERGRKLLLEGVTEFLRSK